MLKKVIICLALSGAPQFAAAQSVQDQIVSQLRGQGFTEITMQRTWLGRIRVVALRDDLRRELVFNPQTGEILRDYWQEIDDDEGPTLFNPGGGSGGSGSNGNGNGASSGGSGNGGGDEDDDDDDDEDDDEEDDEDDDDDDDDEDDEDDDEDEEDEDDDDDDE